jgi:hypothetical protein
MKNQITVCPYCHHQHQSQSTSIIAPARIINPRLTFTPDTQGVRVSWSVDGFAFDASEDMPMHLPNGSQTLPSWIANKYGLWVFDVLKQKPARVTARNLALSVPAAVHSSVTDWGRSGRP